MLDRLPAKFQQTYFWFEEDFEHGPYSSWMAKYWHWSIYISIAYVVIIFGLQRLMRDRPPFDLRRPLILWSASLSVFSIVCAFRLAQEFVMYARDYGWKATMCDDRYGMDGVNGFWSMLFVWSKLPELGDTLFIVLRKQPLIFLHWYHHITVFVYSWYSYPLMLAPGRYFVDLNALVHAFMYTYYALKASRLVRIPRQINVCLTLIQTSQMVVGCVINTLAWKFRSQGEFCSTTDNNIRVSLLMYFSYFILFAHYFYKTYFVKKAPRKQKEVQNGVHQNGVHINGAHQNGKSHYSNGKASLKTD
ncbi:very long chain fatty acid elongase 6-like [Lytechinus pictus]|uniref:very long chain fatty acid elongase 6-like n=1 Tax=Lytechinus pictus TaxID=7653 RepID=UPI00240D0046|nr:elongation of very long chain fatty acids protein 6-like [Lytechinus pictus]